MKKKYPTWFFVMGVFGNLIKTGYGDPGARDKFNKYIDDQIEKNKHE